MKMQTNRRNKTSADRRRGITTIIVMTCLTVALLLVMSWVKTATAERRQIVGLQNRLQAQWLAESALERAAARVAADPTYTGETWQIAAEDFSGRDAAAVVIRVEPIVGRPNAREISAQADFPSDPDRRSRHSKQISIELPTSGDQP